MIRTTCTHNKRHLDSIRNLISSHRIHSLVSLGHFRKHHRSYLYGGGSETEENVFSLALAALLYLSSSFSALVHSRLSAVLCPIHQSQHSPHQLKHSTK